MRTVLIIRMDNDGDVLLAGPAVRAVAATDRVVLLVAPSGEQAARLLPGVRDVYVWPCPWTGFDPPQVDRRSVNTLIDALAIQHIGAAIVLTSYHQSPLPMALILRMAGIKFVAADSEDYPGSLLDLRHRAACGHEVERSLALVRALGYNLPNGDDGRLMIKDALPAVDDGPFIVVHPSASVPARTASADHWTAMVKALAADGNRVVVTGSAAERDLTAKVAGSNAVDLGGRTSYRQLAALLRAARVVVVGNTGPAHLAAAVGTPVVSLFSPVVPADQWAPWRVPSVVLGDQQAPCRASRARVCPIPGHPCLDDVAPEEVVTATRTLIEEVAA
ncbi:ADP-heptose:LPS heptosyltransferase [Kribbella sp. VKM Ac-2527]|uniref:ADP-heptose:LPS heptosyltransferase n=1 Tax=Kribbella caucasensis TaxID=2512215 RepID=A0A4R6KCN8_9ACTN|nr:glycosyltransferase family 9 protein [Kribbella sp. VKM Ac-2527]TDO47969.1 ADP-heptose:LPS heptosyltransferase [Kribbella sp. VKM Ac-2527]